MAGQTRPDPVLAALVGGMRVAGYRLEEQIGQGGMAVVFRAHDERLNRVVALKLLAPSLVTDASAKERFLREAHAAAAVDHPHIVPVHDAGSGASGLLYIATRFVPGGDLRAALAREEGIPRPARVAALISPVASALDAAHQAGLVHRDIKPANILVDSSPGRPDHVYLADFGVSKWTVLPSNLAGIDLTSVSLTSTGDYLGTPEYSAPEQVLGRQVDARTDQYALAVVAFSMLTGERLFRGDQLAVMYAHVSEAPPAATALRPRLPAAVDDVLWRALAKDPGDRFGNCGEFADSLRAALGLASYGSLAEGPAPAAPRPWQPSPRAWPDQAEPVPVMEPLVPGLGPVAAGPLEAEFRPSGPGPVPSGFPATQSMMPWDRPVPHHQAARGRRRSKAVPVAVSVFLVAAIAVGSLALRHWHILWSPVSPSASEGRGGTGPSASPPVTISNAGNSTSAAGDVAGLAPASAAAGVDYVTASQGPGHSLMLSQILAGATNWQPQAVAGAGTTYSVPSVAVTGNTIRIAAAGPGHSLTLYRSDLGSTSWSHATVAGSGTTFSAPSLTVGGGKVLITAEGPKQSLMLYWATIGAGNWHQEMVAPPGTTTAAPSVVVDDAVSPAAVVIAALRPDHSLMAYWTQNGTSTWHTETIAAPDTTLAASSLMLDIATLAIATEGMDHSLTMNYTRSPASPWHSGAMAGPGTTYSAPSIAANGTKVVNVAAQGPAGSLLFYYARRGAPSWTRETVAGAHSTLAVPSIAANGSDSMITAVGPGNVVSSYWSANGTGTWRPAPVRPPAR